MLKLTIRKALTIIMVFVLLAGASPFYASAESGEGENDMLTGFDAESIYVCELNTGRTICERNAGKVLPMRHFAKLMTVLICAEELEKGSLTLDEEVTASAHANSMPSPQIWLEAGDRVTVEDLLKSIIIGNANDACAALSERLSGSEEKHIARMNERAKELGMSKTRFADCNGLDDSTVSTATDLCILSKCIIKYKCFTEYFTTWRDFVKNQAVELVSNNQLIRTFKGTIGVKCWGSGNRTSLIAAVNRREMLMCAVVINESSKDRLFSLTIKLLDKIFESFSLYMPEVDEKYLKDIIVVNGRKRSICVKVNNFNGVLLKRGESSGAVCKADISERVSAPVYEGDVLGVITYSKEGKELLKVCITAAETVEKMDMRYGIYQCLCNLFKI